MRDAQELAAALGRIDGRGHKAYQQLEGGRRLDGFVLHIDHVQGDPFARPTRVRAVLEGQTAGFADSAYRTPQRALGTAAFLARTFAEAARSQCRRSGSGRSGEILMEHPGQVVLPQTAVRVTADGDVEARFTIGLPANGRRIAGRQAIQLLLEDVPRLVHATLLEAAVGAPDVERHAATNEDATALRSALAERHLVAFIADGARLPRRSGVDDRPLDPEGTVSFQSPDSMRVEIDVPNAGTVGGMGIPEGVTLIVGGGFHGKSTLLRAVEAGVYNHPPGDGRDFDEAEVRQVIEESFADWGSPRDFQRIATPFFDPPQENVEIETPDKANGILFARQNLELRDTDPDYAALLLAGEMIGGGVLNSRLSRRIRDEEGLSYVVQAFISGHPVDAAGQFIAVAIFAPENVDKVEAALIEELEKVLSDGFTQEELDGARQGWLEGRQLGRSQDGNLARGLSQNLYFDRTFQFDADLEERVRSATLEEVNQAIRDRLDLSKLTIVKAGDFANKRTTIG